MGRTFKAEDRERHRQTKNRKRQRGASRHNQFSIDPEPMQALEDNDSPDDWQNPYELVEND